MKDFFEEFEDINIKTKNKFFTNSERLFENNFNQYPLEKIRYPDKKLFNELVNLFDRVVVLKQNLSFYFKNSVTNSL